MQLLDKKLSDMPWNLNVAFFHRLCLTPWNSTELKILVKRTQGNSVCLRVCLSNTSHGLHCLKLFYGIFTNSNSQGIQATLINKEVLAPIFISGQYLLCGGGSLTARFTHFPGQPLESLLISSELTSPLRSDRFAKSLSKAEVNAGRQHGHLRIIRRHRAIVYYLLKWNILLLLYEVGYHRYEASTLV